MSVDSIPIWLFFVGTFLIVLVSIYIGWRLGGSARRRSEDENEAPVSGVSGAVLGLTAFMLVFTFSIVADRYDARKALVREDANAIRTTYLRSSFLPEPDRTETKALIGDYLDLRLKFAQEARVERLDNALSEVDRIQRRLWQIAVTNAERDMNSDVAALYVESLNNVFEIHASRIALGVQARIPGGVWLILYALTILGMIATGYHAGVASKRLSKSTLLLALSFAMMNTVIASLDRPGGSHVTQQPLADVHAFILADKAALRR
jgi:hypothetical protein